MGCWRHWKPIATAPTDGRPFLSIAVPFDPQVTHIEGGRLVRFKDDGGVVETLGTHWMTFPDSPESQG
jgi:hypothetical protein